MRVLSFRASRVSALALVAALLAIPSATLSASPAVADQVRERQYWLQDYRIEQAWDITRGAGVRIAIIDTGIDATHPDLVGAVVGELIFRGWGLPMGSPRWALSVDTARWSPRWPQDEEMPEWRA